jgi:tetratricopeptide (TPR) repeat protein
MRSLRQLDRSLTSPLVELRLIVDGHRLLAQSDRVRFDPRSGQMVLDLDTGRIEEAAAATLTTGLVRPMSPPAEQAEAWFARASDWEADPAQWEDAIDAYRRVVALDPSYAAAWNNLGLLVHRMGRHEEARHAYAQAVAADPRLCEASYNLGALAEDLGDLTQAIAHYRAALRLAPDYADAHFNLAGALVRAGRPDEATPHWQRYLQLDAGSPWSRIARAHLERPE